jgi:hypothetical protein
LLYTKKVERGSSVQRLRSAFFPSEVAVSFDRDRSSLFVPPSTQDHIKGVLNATVVLVMYGDYQCLLMELDIAIAGILSS